MKPRSRGICDILGKVVTWVHGVDIGGRDDFGEKS